MIKIFEKILNLLKSENKEVVNENIEQSSHKELEVVNYLKNRFKHLYINICGETQGNVFDLKGCGKLLGWCWESTQTCSLFLKDDDYIERGDLFIEDDTSLKNTKKPYYHSWICFKFNGKEYVFDPCLDYLCEKETYYKHFTPNVQGKTTAGEVKKYVVEKIKNKPERKKSFLDDFISEDLKQKLNKQTTIDGTEDVNAPIYRGTVGYTAKINRDKIEEIDAHYYMSGMF